MTEPGILMPEHEAPRYENVESSDHTAGLEEFRNHNNNERACDDIVKPNIVENSLPSVNQNTDVIAAGKEQSMFCADTRELTMIHRYYMERKSGAGDGSIERPDNCPEEGYPIHGRQGIGRTGTARSGNQIGARLRALDFKD